MTTPSKDPIAAIIEGPSPAPDPVNHRSPSSVAAYEAIKASGVLSERRMQAYTTLYLHGPLTRNELNAKAQAMFASKAQFDKRLAELQAMDLIGRLPDDRECTVTHYVIDVWDVTGRLPPATSADATPTHLPRPPRDVLKTAVRQLRRMMRGGPPLPVDPAAVPASWKMTPEQMTPELTRVCRWLASLADDLQPASGD